MTGKVYQFPSIDKTKKGSPVLRGAETDERKLVELPDGDYRGKLYGYYLELEDGQRYRIPYGVKKSRRLANFQDISIKQGRIQRKATTRFSGMAEMGGVLQGKSYGPKPPTSYDITRVSFDENFQIPEGVRKEFKLKTKAYSLDKKGVFNGSIGKASIGVSKDDSVIRSSTSRLDSPNQGSSLTPSINSQPNKMSNVALDWDKGNPFHLAVEPWMTSGLQSDTADGLYIGSIKGDVIETSNANITLTVSVKVNYPESVLVLIKNRKAYIFKQSQLAATSGSKIFSTVLFSKIESDEQFRDYAHNLMKNAHGEKYSEETTDKVVDGILANKDEDYGAKIGRLKSGLKKSKKFSYILSEDDLLRTFADSKEDKKDEEDPKDRKEDKEKDPKDKDKKGPKEEKSPRESDESKDEKSEPKSDPKSESKEDSKGDEKKGEGSIETAKGTKLTRTVPAETKPDKVETTTSSGSKFVMSKEGDNTPNAFKTARPDESNVGSDKQVSSVDSQVKGLSKPSIEAPSEYKFELTPTEPKMEMQAVIGTLVMSSSYAHLFHLVTTDYAKHKALEDYYERVPELVDRLAENYLATTSSTNLQICVVPTGLDPIPYFEDLQDFLTKYSAEKLRSETQFQSMVDEILALIGRTLYKLKRLKMGGKIFSMRTFSTTSRALDASRDFIVEMVKSAAKKIGKKPISELKDTSDKEIDKFVKGNVATESDAVNVIGAITKSVLTGVTKSIS